MQNPRLTEEEINQFLQACEDFSRLGCTFTGSIRSALDDLKRTYDPVLNSSYVDKAVVELLTRSLSEFEKKLEANLQGINKICTKGGKWFAFYLGKSVGIHSNGGHQQEQPTLPDEIRLSRTSSGARNLLVHSKKEGLES